LGAAGAAGGGPVGAEGAVQVVSLGAIVVTGAIVIVPIIHADGVW